MKTIAEFPDQSVVAEEAAEWLIRLDADTPPSEQALQALGEWLHRSPAHWKELERLADLWGRLNVLTDLAVPLGKPGGVPARGTHDRLAARVKLFRSRRLLAACLAGSAVIAVLIGFVLTRTPTADPSLATNGLYATAVGQQKTTALADGSEVILNTNSQIRVEYSDMYREVHLLQGEALFTVSRNAARPFRVYAGNGRIEALGTAFSVHLKGEEVDVTVAEGRVSLASIKPSRPKGEKPSVDVPQRTTLPGSGRRLEGEFVKSLGTLSAGQVATIRSTPLEAAAGSVAAIEIVEPITSDELAERLAWREGVLMFSGDTLEDVVREVSRYTTLSIEIADPVVGAMRIGGRFPVGETEAMLAALEANFDLRVSRIGRHRVVLSAASE